MSAVAGDAASVWPLPGALVRADGEARRVGVELELQGLPVETLAEIVADTLGGDIEPVSIAEYIVDVPEYGPFRIEIDFKILKRMARQYRSPELAESATVEGLAVDLLSDASSLLVPCEIVAPPIPMEAVGAPIDALVDAARAAGARGTRQSPLYAFGVHLNIEPPAMEASTVLAYLRAFVCLLDWIIWRGDVDIVRRVTPYIDRFPRAYDLLVTDPGYRPDWERLIADYLAHNPTRNRAFDMLPMMSSVDAAQVRAVVDDPLVNARPAFHYRVADSRVDEPGWGVRQPWEHWLKIEQLAADSDNLLDCCAAFQADRARVLHPVDRQWRYEVERWLDL